MHKNSGEIYYFREENWDATDEDVDAAERCAQDLLNEYFSDYL